jgi:glycosyltransferase involved in cell wall biosynthesis
LKVLYDGWALARRPDSQAALHLFTLLAHRPEEIQAVVAMPGPPPGWLPREVNVTIQPTADTDLGRLLWEQRSLPRLARAHKAGLLHLVSINPALFGAVKSVISPAGFDLGHWEDGTAGLEPAERAGEQASLAARLREALSFGGMARARAVFWPSDLPAPELGIPVIPMPPVLPPPFSRTVTAFEASGTMPELELPDGFILYHGPTNRKALHRLLEAWSWAAGAIGDAYPLLLVGFHGSGREALSGMIREYDLGQTVRALPAVSPDLLARVYERCTALFHPAPVSPWDGPVRLALSCGKPVVALESPLADALVGPAAYLAPADEPTAERDRKTAGRGRKLAAALITVVVEENLAEALSQSARKRAAAWGTAGQSAVFSQALSAAYLSILSPR